MKTDQVREGIGETLRGVALIVLVGVALGLAYNALGLASRPARGLSWIARPEKMPSLEELQPGSRLLPAPRPERGPARAFALVGTAWAGEAVVLAAPADSAHGTHARKAAVTARKKAAKKPAPVPKPVMKAPPATTPAAPAAPAVKADLPVVPDLDQPIEVKLANVKKFYDAQAALIVDAREPEEYADGHIAGALSVPYDDVVAKPELLDPFKKAGRPIIAYCSGGDCEVSKDLAKSMLAAGIRKVLVFTDGFPAWKAAGYPVATGPAKAGH